MVKVDMMVSPRLTEIVIAWDCYHHEDLDPDSPALDPPEIFY